MAAAAPVPGTGSRISRQHCVAIAVLAALAWIAPAGAHTPLDPAIVAEGHPTAHTQDHGDMIWPPQPRGITNVTSRADTGDRARLAKAQEKLAAALERVALVGPDVRQALGNRYTRIAVQQHAGKDGTPAEPVLVYFSHATNSTVEVAMDRQRVRSVHRVSAAEYQPEITDEEVTEAEGIARSHFAGLGEERVAQLEAFGILAYKPTGSGFYDTRVLYISFHPDNDSFPEYAAWVDLTNRRVIRTLIE
ncbi:MAG: hypothetical protein QY320_03545 [Gammaproteobacteria bacterium]|nr:MAG: hypothetical protein QY320_03545 [Gammaproteobacteria bacterium]